MGVKTLPLEGLILLLMGTLRLLLSRSDMLVAANFLFREDTGGLLSLPNVMGPSSSDSLEVLSELKEQVNIFLAHFSVQN